MYSTTVARSLLAMALVASLAASAPVAEPNSLAVRNPAFGGGSEPIVTGPEPVISEPESTPEETQPEETQPEETQPEETQPDSNPASGSTGSSKPPATSSSKGSGDGLTKASTIAGIFGGFSGIGGLINSLLHEPNTQATPNCGFFHKLIADCPAPIAAPATTAASAPAPTGTAPLTATSSAAPQKREIVASSGSDFNSHCGFFHRFIHDCPSATTVTIETSSTSTAVTSPTIVSPHLGVFPPVIGIPVNSTIQHLSPTIAQSTGVVEVPTGAHRILPTPPVVVARRFQA